jgi:hypothetical protein
MRFTFAFVIVSIPLIASAQLPHLGTWAVDDAKSDGGEQVWEYVDLGSGLWEFRSGGRRIFHFRMDDDECATCEASFYTWELIGPDTYLTSLVGPWARDIVKIAPDDSSLSFIQRRPGATGELEEHVGTFQRLAGGPGLAGTWLAKSEKNTSSPTLNLSAGVEEWLVFKWTSLGGPANAWTCVLLADGADHPCFNALARGWTISMGLTDARTLQSVIKANGATDTKATYTVSADGRSMVRAQRSASGGIINTVYVRQ